MGLYDIIICEYPLPDKKNQDKEFQTKSLNNTLDSYIITKKGKLVLKKAKYFSVVKKVFSRKIGINFHGFIFFYTNDDKKKWHEYKAKFTDGKIVSIKKIKRKQKTL